ncbi:hypothetical protein H920_04536 [Fukomys damarensis]|uniref:Uncharacterized protein n=1 Tax=Fukomys damarensis TaxID=885580 RepID=A0A091DSG7_FUKDA|nr:hypothetical protein H920_04536 [Fukomys damarensis]
MPCRTESALNKPLAAVTAPVATICYSNPPHTQPMTHSRILLVTFPCGCWVITSDTGREGGKKGGGDQTGRERERQEEKEKEEEKEEDEEDKKEDEDEKKKQKKWEG